MTIEKMAKFTISREICTLWGKLSMDGVNNWLPLWLHLYDTGEVAKRLWEMWLPEHTKQKIMDGIVLPENGNNKAEKREYAKSIFVFLAFVHDIGKASPIFTIKAAKIGFNDIVDEIAGCGLKVSVKKSSMNNSFTHALVGERILELAGLDRSLAAIVGGHHGKPPSNDTEIERADIYPDATGIGDSAWDKVHREIIAFALSYAGLQEIPSRKALLPAQVIMSGLIIMADWLASGTNFFPLIARDYIGFSLAEAQGRGAEAWEKISLPSPAVFSAECGWADLFQERFGRTPRPLQTAAVAIAQKVKNPGLFVIEAPMGEGKTEAALAIAEIIANRTGLGGIYFALPTQATSDGIFPRITRWISSLNSGVSRSIFLAHGKSGFNKDYTGIKMNPIIYDEEHSEYRQAAAVVNDWTMGRKKGILADFVVGTVDHVLMAGLKAKHLALRHLGLSNKIVIIDECHAYDAYMSSYLDLVLNWLGAYQVPVILLSATLPVARRKAMLEAYRDSYARKEKKKLSLADIRTGKQRSVPQNEGFEQPEKLQYPIISYTDGEKVYDQAPAPSGRCLQVKIKQLSAECLAAELKKLLVVGGCIGVIRNTVKEAQETTQELEKIFGEDNVFLLHSRFISVDRVKKERIVRGKLGPGEENRPGTMIVVGTQVMEQSLDVDFDVLFTDICPMDLLLQRIGRLHRHERKAPRPELMREAVCYVMGIEQDLLFGKGSSAVYGDYLLLKTRAFLPQSLTLPADIPGLVYKAYEDGFASAAKEQLKLLEDESLVEKVYNSAKEKYSRIIAEKKQRAEIFQIKRPRLQKDTLIGWVRTDYKEDASGKRGEATVRDSNDSVQVIVVRKKANGKFYTVPWLEKMADFEIPETPSDDLAKAIAGCSVTLPAAFSAVWNIDKTINELEEMLLKNGLEGWYASCWLQGELFLVLEENYEVVLLDKILRYDEKYGLYIQGE